MTSPKPSTSVITRQPTGDISLQGPNGKFFLRVPAEDFPFLTPGASVLVALTIVKPEFGTPDAIPNIPLN